MHLKHCKAFIFGPIQCVLIHIGLIWCLNSLKRSERCLSGRHVQRWLETHAQMSEAGGGICARLRLSLRIFYSSISIVMWVLVLLCWSLNECNVWWQIWMLGSCLGQAALYPHSPCVIQLSPALQVTDPRGFMAVWVMKSSPKTSLMTLWLLPEGRGGEYLAH